MNKKIITIILLFIILPLKSYGKKIEIVLKIDEEIVTNFDIANEINYLSFLNPKLKTIDKQRLYNIAKSSLTREIVKEKKLKSFLSLNINDDVKKILNKN